MLPYFTFSSAACVLIREGTCSVLDILQVCRECRHLDRIMGTDYFHESHFFGLLDRVKV